MGLDINDYSASYGQLHRLRQFALDVEFGKGKVDLHELYDKLPDEDYDKFKKETKFYEIINHSDCDGGYIDLKKMGLKIKNEDKFRKSLMWGDLNKLKEEVEELNKHKEILEGWDLQSWDMFYSDVTEAVGILWFR